jgi:FAD/FMN-containing dehydrogenase
MSSSIERLREQLDQSEVHLPGTVEYLAQSLPWSQHADAKPKLVITPSTLPSLQACVKLLYADESLDFAVRNTGTGSASARDIILSMHGFKSFSFDAATEIVSIGAGLDWSEVEVKMAAAAPGWALVGARCGWVGAAGGALVGGYSWLSHEFGLISDPQNLLDAQVVLRDGRVVWAGEEDDGALLWALRGGGGNFGVVVGLKMRARRYHEAIFAGLVFLPYERLKEVGEWVERAVDRLKDPKTAFFITNQGPGTGVLPQGAKPGIAMVLFDAHAEEHARSKEEGFGEIFEMEGLVEISCGLVPLSGMTKLAESYKSYQGVNQFWGSAPLMEEKVDASIIKRAWDWYARTIEECPVLDQGSTVLFEFCQAVSQSIAPECEKPLLTYLKRGSSILRIRTQHQAGHTQAANMSCRSCLAATLQVYLRTSKTLYIIASRSRRRRLEVVKRQESIMRDFCTLGTTSIGYLAATWKDFGR